MGLGLRIAVPSVSMLAALAVLSGCQGAGTPGDANPPPVDGSALRLYLAAWGESWQGWSDDLQRLDDDPVDAYSAIPDATWEPAGRAYAAAATAYRDRERHLDVLDPPSVLSGAHDDYLATVRRQKMRLQAVADALGGTDPHALERADAALQLSQMTADVDGARWEEAVIAACTASGIEVPEIVRRKYISNGQRKTA